MTRSRPLLLASLLGALALPASLPGAAHAGGSGVGIPETGGQGAGAASADARGLSANPAAAVGGRGSEVHVDAAWMYLLVHYQRAPYPGTDPSTDPERRFKNADSLNMAVVPYAAIRSDALFKPRGGESKVGIGLSVAVPFGRNVHFRPSHPGRYHLVTADFATVYATPAIAIRPIPALRFGIGPVIGRTTLRLRQRLDLAPTLQELMPGDPPPPPEMGLLEGEILVRHAEGYSYGFAAGTLLDIGEDLTLGLGFLSGQQVSVEGRSRVTPSRSLALYTKGDFTLTQNLPPVVNLGGRYRVPDSPWEFSLEGQWLGWSVNRYFHLEIENSEIATTNAEMQDMLDFLSAQGYDLNEGQVVENIFDKDQYIARGHRNTWNLIGGAEYRWPNLLTRFQLGFDRSAVPDGNVNIGNVDFNAVVVGAGATWEPRGSRFSTGVSFTQYVNLTRRVEESNFQTHGTPHEYAFPSGEGTYSAELSRLAVHAGYRF